ncbi:hypothetical protein POM88_019746 [Heracleum sosnowskyi]|uniref:F-box domain-containing protein n=1 Tax=Heracleum sosnowskyi TaxID=360622 RepID=A0AAD8IAI0_9APIA|nr:hypothetical protein POM88_019746 [Heracleum sosnowskyi]
MGRTGKVRSSSRGRRRGRRRVKKDQKCKEDRISQLSDDLIDHILSYVSSDLAVQTMVLSKRWLNLWTTLSCLNFKRPVSAGNYENFVTNFLENRNQQCVLSKFSFDCYSGARKILSICLDYALCHKVEHLSICWVDLADYPCRINFACVKTLHLKLCENLRMLNFWTLPSLTSFYLKTSRIGQVLRFENLKELTLDLMYPEKPTEETITINCPKLQSLTLKPYFRHKFIVSAPNLYYLSYCSRHVSAFSTTDGFRCIKQVHIDIRKKFGDFFDLSGLPNGNVRKLAMQNFISMLKAVRETPFLELSSETITGLRMIPNLSEYEHPSLGNLNFICLRGAGLFDLRPPRSTDYVINYLLTNSPCAKIIRRL